MSSLSCPALDRLGRRPSKYSGATHTEALTSELWSEARILVLGAGGVGSELLHLLALSGFYNIDVVDMDTVDLTNLNRQFLFREGDIGKSKVCAAASYIRQRFPHVNITEHFMKIQEKPPTFFQQFQFVLLAVDSVPARQWVNEMLASLVLWRPSGSAADGVYEADEAASPIPYIDMGSEQFTCTLRRVLHGAVECIQCTNRYVETKTVQMCTLETIPRQPEHCVVYVRAKLWEDLRPFGEVEKDGRMVPVPVDGDDDAHIAWIAKHAVERQNKFKIPGTIDFTFTQGVVKNSVAAIGFTNALVAAVAVGEMIKILTDIGKPSSSYTLFNGGNRVYSSSTDLERNPSCKVCMPQHHLTLPTSARRTDVLRALIDHPTFKKIASRRSSRKPCNVYLRQYISEKLFFSVCPSGTITNDVDMHREVSTGSFSSRQHSHDATHGGHRADSQGGFSMQRESSVVCGETGDDDPSHIYGCRDVLLERLQELHGHESDETLLTHLTLSPADIEYTSIYVVTFDTKFLIQWEA